MAAGLPQWSVPAAPAIEIHQATTDDVTADLPRPTVTHARRRSSREQQVTAHAAALRDLKVIASFCRAARRDVGRGALRFVVLMHMVRRSAVRIQRAWRCFFWRRNHLLESHLRAWCAAQGIISEHEMIDRWQRHNVHVQRLHRFGIESKTSAHVGTYVKGLADAMASNNLDKNVMMEVLMQAYIEAREVYRNRVRSAMNRREWLRELPSFLRVFHKHDPTRSFTMSIQTGGPHAGGTQHRGLDFEFSLEECQARYAALKHHDGAIRGAKKDEASNDDDLFQFEAFGEDDVPQLAVTEAATLQASHELSLVASNADMEQAGLIHRAAKSALRYAGTPSLRRLDYAALPPVSAVREEKTMWTNDLGVYAALRRSRDAMVLARARRLSMGYEEEQQKRRGSRRKSSIAASAAQAASSMTRSGRASVAAVATHTESRNLGRSPKPALPEAARRASRSVTRLSAVDPLAAAAAELQVEEERDGGLGPRELRQRERTLHKERRAATMQRRRLANRPLSADVTFISPDRSAAMARPLTAASTHRRTPSPDRRKLRPVTAPAAPAEQFPPRAASAMSRIPPPSAAVQRLRRSAARSPAAATPVMASPLVSRGSAPQPQQRARTAGAYRAAPAVVQQRLAAIRVSKAAASYDNPLRVAERLRYKPVAAHEVSSILLESPVHSAARNLSRLRGHVTPSLDTVLQREWDAFLDNR